MRSYPVLLKNIPNNQIIAFTQSHPSLINKMHYSEDGSKIILHSNLSKELFVKMLDDAFLTSQLTAQYYESIAKDVVEGEEENEIVEE